MWKSSTKSPEYGYMLLKFADIGPEPMIGENLPIDDETDYFEIGQSLGLYLFLIASQGKGGAEMGFYGPLPYKETPYHDILAFSFYARDPTAYDPRSKEFGVMTFFVIFVPQEDNKLKRARVAFEKALSITFVEKYPQKPLITDETIPILLSQGKTVVWRTLGAGELILQEEAMNQILTDPRLHYLSFYNEIDRSLAFTVIGSEEDYQDKIKSILDLKMDIFLYEYQKSRKIGYIAFPAYQKFAIMIFASTNTNESNFFTQDDFFEFGKKLYFALPLIKEYYSI
ncbi:MAG: hypothetical protein ACFFCQ_07650 [Promethearchaeota archaeon]